MFMGAAIRGAERKGKEMKALNTINTQDLNDILSAARLVLTEQNATFNEMFRAAFGALFCNVERPLFGDKITAYEDNKSKVPQVLADIAIELDARLYA